MTLTPAYGRDYKSKKEVLKDFNAGKDFYLHEFHSPGQYINKEQIAKGTRIFFRYGNFRKVFVYTCE